MRLFVSYRRSDTEDFAGRLAYRLRDAPGVDHVFFDVDAIDPGEPFELRLKSALTGCDVCLVVIGPDWRGQRAPGQGDRIQDPGDFVRMEVALSLAICPKVIPVLAKGADVPLKETLPEVLHPLLDLNAVSIRHVSFERDVDYLLDVISGRRTPTGARRSLGRHPAVVAIARGALGVAGALAALLALAVIHNIVTGGRSLDETLGRGPLVALIILVLVGGALLPGTFHRLRQRGRSWSKSNT
jgi:hypothetical protein